jgi:PilZ domain
MVAGHLEILIDIRNLLAQGYVPLVDADGRTVYLVQSSARSIRGGLAFNF